MEAALDDLCKNTNDSAAAMDAESKELLMSYFSHMAFFLVAGKEMTNPSNLVDYHNKMAQSGE